MKSLLRNAWLLVSLAAAINALSPVARGGALPAPSVIGLSLLFEGPTTPGLDGNSRLVFDIVDSTETQILGSNLWILDPNGNFLAAASPSLPSTGTNVGLNSTLLVQGQADGNTTVVFLFGNVSGLEAGVTSFGVWTYNPSGRLIASASYGPYANTVVSDLTWSQSTGKLLVKWTSGGSGVLVPGTGTVSAWTVNEFGGIDTAAGPFGPFAGTLLSKIILLKDGTQQWIWASQNSNATITTAVWSISSSGQVRAVRQFGPF
ncbi:MAG: hypothetical protein JO015_08390 [Verrucomicrobia bacterium]|nr:hypothetical protein [Verrucomicrobiota bacterium]